MARLHDIKEIDLDNTYWGIATSLWFNHCPHHCLWLGCWNSETWHKDDSLTVDNDEVIEKTLKYLDSYNVPKNLTLLGGEPFSPYNIDDLLYILEGVLDARPNTKVLSWSGYEFFVLKRTAKFKQVLKYVDVIVCGRFMEEYKCKDTTKMYGSENQYIVDVKESLRADKTVYIEKGDSFLGLEEIYLNKRKA